MKAYATEEEAQKECDIKNAEPATGFCPLINGGCNKDCVCYSRSFPFKKQTYPNIEWAAGYTGCGNAMFFQE